MGESTTGIGRIRRVSLRQVWPREDYDFTPWLQENLDVLNDALGIGLASADSEEAARDFSVDLLAEGDEGRLTVIENQLGCSEEACRVGEKKQGLSERHQLRGQF